VQLKTPLRSRRARRLQEVRGRGGGGNPPSSRASRLNIPAEYRCRRHRAFMVGSYGMIHDGGEHFDIEVPAFSLDFLLRRANHQLAQFSSASPPIPLVPAKRGPSARLFWIPASAE